MPLVVSFRQLWPFHSVTHLVEQIALDKQKLRIITIWDEKKEKELQVLTNNLDWPAHVVAELYKRRWNVEVFFKGLKQNLQVKPFIGTSENAVKSQIYEPGSTFFPYVQFPWTVKTYCKLFFIFSLYK